MKLSTKYTAISSTLSSLVPYLGKSPSISKSTATPASFLIVLTLACFIADNESAVTERPAIPQAIVLNTSLSCRAISNAS